MALADAVAQPRRRGGHWGVGGGVHAVEPMVDIWGRLRRRDGWMWLSDDPTDRAIAVGLCNGCEVIKACDDLARAMPARFGVSAGHDHTARAKKPVCREQDHDHSCRADCGVPRRSCDHAGPAIHPNTSPPNIPPTCPHVNDHENGE